MTSEEILKCVFLTPEERAEFERMKPPTPNDLHETTNMLLRELVSELALNRDSLQREFALLRQAIIKPRMQ